ncbi:antibiotic biosynthesis monooxygenase family protein [Kangiella sediminilitoris]|uniref:Antibiotic biosynthesis monooxygenase n=1 Tax=Kangiella sediminilitoris TaxID=1144748 RepID=A0A1B3B8B7_9GAMM|nr:antibiotic biosynthesis monooxygenase family protein [Kangiella sediminilitoris]AOE49011.1 Antibiotic biosynthesis monooxygenase [Kangiella sediminilitoris]
MVRIIIERNILDGKLDDYHTLIRQAKNKASNMPGFLSGEIFHVKEHPNQVIVMSCWDSFDTWEVWADSEERLDLLEEIRPLLEKDEKIMVLEATNLKKD